MNSSIKNILHVDLAEKYYEVKTHGDLREYVGGIGVGIKLLDQYTESSERSKPIVFSVGPLNGFFPFVSKTSVVLRQNGVIEDLYMGGTLSHRISYTGMDAILISGSSKDPVFVEINDDEVVFHNENTSVHSMGLPGKKATLLLDSGKALLDGYFGTPEEFLSSAFLEKKLLGVVITGTKTFEPENWERYNSLYKELLEKINQVKVHKGEFPSCAGCPLGCSPSYAGEIGGNILTHSLVACGYAENIYSDIGVVFSCLNVLGYDYNHEDIENLPEVVSKILKKY